MKNTRWISLILAALLITMCFAGCSAQMKDAGYAVPEYNGIYYSEDSSEVVHAQGVTTEELIPTSAGSTDVLNQKLIRTMTLEVETADLDALLSDLNGKIGALNGYVEYKSVRNGSSTATRRYRYAKLTIRVPVDQLDNFVAHVSDATNVVSYNESADDITLSYVATQSRITALETEQKRLLELLAKAENMTDLLQIEKRLTEVRTELEEVTSRLRLYDNLVDYGTVELSVTEVQEFTVVEEETVWKRIATGFVESCKNIWQIVTDLFVFCITSLPYLLPAGVIILGVILLVRIGGKKKNKKNKPTEET